MKYMENNKYHIIYKELQSLIDDLNISKNDLIQKRVNHEINRKDIDEAYNKIQNHIKYIHEVFVNDCYFIMNDILESHIFEAASYKNLYSIKVETQQALYHFIYTFKGDIHPTIIYDIIFKSVQSIDEKRNIKYGYDNEYLRIDKDRFNVIQNIYYMKKYILELFGFDDLQIYEQ